MDLRVALSVCAICVGGLASAQSSETLADIRQDIVVLNTELARLKQELNTTGGSDVQVGGSVLDRMNAIEAELQRITARTEELGNRVDRIVKDGTNRLGDLEFRVCEALSDCDIGSVGQTAPLGGETAHVAPPPAPAPATDALPIGDGQLAISEEADFRAAQDAFASGDHQGAAQLFAQFRESYPMGPLEAAALLYEGQALEAQGDTREAARRYLTAYSNFPDAQVAPESLWRLGTSLGALGSVPEACVTLGEVSKRYPGTDFVQAAADSRIKLGCQ